MKFAWTALMAMALAACATTPPATQTAHDAPRASDTCVLLSVARQGSAETHLTPVLQQRLHGIQTTELQRPAYQCGDAHYQTDPNQLGLTYLAMGFSSDHRFAVLKMQTVAGPLAAEGFTCLYEAADESWTLRGCQNDWIT